MNTDRIEKKILLRASRSRVWSALTDYRQFGEWFGMKFDRPFEPGARMTGVVGQTTVDAEVARLQKTHEGLPFEIVVEQIEPERLFSFRWHPHAIEPGADYSSEPMTLVAFTLEDASGGILLTVTESGFEQIPLARRAKALEANDGGWGMVVTLIDKYVSHA